MLIYHQLIYQPTYLHSGSLGHPSKKLLGNLPSTGLPTNLPTYWLLGPPELEKLLGNLPSTDLPTNLPTQLLLRPPKQEKLLGNLPLTDLPSQWLLRPP